MSRSFARVLALVLLASVWLPRATQAQAPVVHTVAFGATLASLSALTGVSVNELAQMNGLTRGDTSIEGSPIKLPERASSSVRLHRVSSGESLIETLCITGCRRSCCGR